MVPYCSCAREKVANRKNLSKKGESIDVFDDRGSNANAISIF
jgi:hypothetical protein